jgi:hypothetical protein
LSSRDDLSRLLQQHDQDVEGLPLELHAASLLAQFAGGRISFEDAESEEAFLWTWRHLSVQSTSSIRRAS